MPDEKFELTDEYKAMIDKMRKVEERNIIEYVSLERIKHRFHSDMGQPD